MESSITSTLTARNQYPILLHGLVGLSDDQKKAKLRNLCLTDLFFLLRYGLNRADIDRDWLFDRCREVQASPNGHLDLWAREHYKSTIITFGLTIQDILNDPNETFGIFSHTRPNAKAFLRQIKNELEINGNLKDWFPDILWRDPKTEAPKWSEDEGIVVRRTANQKEATVEAWGLVDGQPTGRHFGKRVYDDVVTRESVTTGEMIRKTTEAWELSVNLGREGGHERYIGTRYALSDSYETMMERGVVKLRKYAATHNGLPDGKPVLLLQETLDARRARMGPYTFSCQMLQDPLPADAAFFKREWLPFRQQEPKSFRAYLSSDFGVSEEGDPTEIGIHGIDEAGVLHLGLDGWGGQKSPDVWIDEYLTLVARHKPLCEFNEGGVIRRAIEPFLIKRRRERRIYGRTEWITPISDKATRARSLQAMAASGKVTLPDTPYGHRLLGDLLKFPRSKDDHTVDMCALMALALDQAHSAIVQPKAAEFKRKERWQMDDDDDQSESWRAA